jgi:hypothetical protein
MFVVAQSGEIVQLVVQTERTLTFTLHSPEDMFHMESTKSKFVQHYVTILTCPVSL